MSDALLDPQELEAIQNAIRETAPRKGANGAVDVEPTRLALIADDRSVEATRPVLLMVANRWTRKSLALRNYLPGQWSLDVVGAEAIDGRLAKEELRDSWVAGGKAGTAEIVFAVQGAVIDIAAATRCGAAAPTADNTRTPSAISLRLFAPVGRALFDTLGPVWQETFDNELTASSELAIVQRLIESHTIIRVSVAFNGAINGRVHIYARPETLLAKPAALAAIKAKAALVANALATVPVDVVVELGTLRMSLGKVRSLEKGATHVLPSFVDSPVPVYCGGVLKAWGKPVVCRGVLAVQIISVVHGQGNQS